MKTLTLTTVHGEPIEATPSSSTTPSVWITINGGNAYLISAEVLREVLDAVDALEA